MSPFVLFVFLFCHLLSLILEFIVLSCYSMCVMCTCNLVVFTGGDISERNIIVIEHLLHLLLDFRYIVLAVVAMYSKHCMLIIVIR